MQGLSLTLSSLFHFPFIAFLFLIGTRGSMSDKCFCIMHTFSFKKKNCGDFSVYDCGYFTSMGIAWLIQLYYFITGYCVFKLISQFSGCTWIVGCFCWTGFCGWNPSDLSIPLEMDVRAGSRNLSRPQNPHCLCQCPLLNFAPSSKDHFLSAHIHLPHVFKYPYDISSFLDVLEFF